MWAVKLKESFIGHKREGFRKYKGRDINIEWNVKKVDIKPVLRKIQIYSETHESHFNEEQSSTIVGSSFS